MLIKQHTYICKAVGTCLLNLLIHSYSVLGVVLDSSAAARTGGHGRRVDFVLGGATAADARRTPSGPARAPRLHTRRRPSTFPLPHETRGAAAAMDGWAEHARERLGLQRAPSRGVVAVRRAVPVAGVGLAVEDKRACDMISMPAPVRSKLRDGVATDQPEWCERSIESLRTRRIMGTKAS